VVDMIQVDGEPMHCLMLTDNEFTRCVLVAVGQQSSLIKKMREISEVLYISGDPVIDNMSRSRGGYPTINHAKINLQVISVQDYLEGFDSLKAYQFTATGEHIE
jgi:hypothetical protein